MPNAKRQTRTWVVTVIPKCQGSVNDVKTPCERKGCHGCAKLSPKSLDVKDMKEAPGDVAQRGKAC